jgi:hypothetical protein
LLYACLPLLLLLLEQRARGAADYHFHRRQPTKR